MRGESETLGLLLYLDAYRASVWAYLGLNLIFLGGQVKMSVSENGCIFGGGSFIRPASVNRF